MTLTDSCPYSQHPARESFKPLSPIHGLSPWPFFLDFALFPDLFLFFPGFFFLALLFILDPLGGDPCIHPLGSAIASLALKVIGLCWNCLVLSRLVWLPSVTPFLDKAIKCHNPPQSWLPWLTSTHIGLIQSPRRGIRHNRHSINVCSFEFTHNSGYKMGSLPASQQSLQWPCLCSFPSFGGILFCPQTHCLNGISYFLISHISLVIVSDQRREKLAKP